MTRIAATVLLTGATGLIGRRLAEALLRRGDTVVGVSRSSQKLDSLVDMACNLRGTFVPLQADLLHEDIPALVERLASNDMAPEHLVNNARDLQNYGLRADGWPERTQWRNEFELGVVAAAELAVALANVHGSRLRSVVNIASIYGVVAMHLPLYDHPERETPPHYGIVKAALIHLTKELAVRLAGRGVSVNAISYGGVEGRADEVFRERYAAQAPNGRMVRLDEVFQPVEYLLFNAPNALTGQNLIVDGGWTLW